MITVLFLFVSLLPFVWTAKSCGMEDTLCSLCGKRSTENLDLTALRNAVRVNRKDIDELKALKPGSPGVAFFAYLSKNWNQFTKYKTLIYDVVDLNDGNGYDKTTGKFIAPSSGTYVFYVSTGATDKTHASVQLVLESTVKNIAWADSYDHNDRTYTTSVTPLRLKKGDVVSTRIGIAFGGRFLESNGYIRTSFSGVKVN